MAAEFLGVKWTGTKLRAANFGLDAVPGRAKDWPSVVDAVPGREFPELDAVGEPRERKRWRSAADAPREPPTGDPPSVPLSEDPPMFLLTGDPSDPPCPPSDGVEGELARDAAVGELSEDPTLLGAALP